MFKTLKEWLANISEKPDVDDALEKMKTQVGVILYHVIIADEQQTDEECELFCKLFKSRFNEEETAIRQRFDQLRRLEGTLGVQVDVIKKHLSDDGKDYMELMKIVNDMINVDGIDDREYQVFSEIKKKLSKIN